MNPTSEATWPDGLLLAYYGDDFTGSTDAMEAMAAAGVPTVLCLEKPTRELLSRFPEVRCVGMAGSSRGRSGAWMDDELPRAFASLAALGAPILQYKVCSTFDSSPEVGSIGRAIDIGVKQMPGSWAPMVVGAPRLRRYQVFGNLFAAVDGAGYRLDRHPTMSRHPVTPMNEADLRVHLARQTRRRIELIDMIQLRTADAASSVQAPATPSLPVAGPVDAIAAVSGSCSPVTAAQIGWARAHGFRVERLDLRRALEPRNGEAEVDRAVDVAAGAIAQGESVIVHSAEGPHDPAVTGFDAIAAAAGLPRYDAARKVGRALAEVMRRLLDRVDLSRVVVAGGDSSGEVVSTLGIDALSVAAGLAPGAPLCRAWSAQSRRDGLQIALKGGQIGDAAFFGAVRDGRM